MGSTSGPTVGVVGDAPRGVADRLAERDARPVDGAAGDVLAADPDWLVAVGESALLDLVRGGIDRPVLPVAAGRGVGSVSRDDAPAAVDAVVDGDAGEVSRRLVSVSVDGATTTALLDVTLLTAEPAQISEYEIRADGRPVSTLRADGLVVATPAGSYGYAANVGGPAIQPGADVVSVVPIAPFVTDAEHWVLAMEAVTVEPRRHEPVAVIVDDRSWREVDPGETVRIEPGGRVSLLATSASHGFARAASGLEKL